MPPTLILDTNVVVAGLRSSRGAGHALLQAVGSGAFVHGLTAALVLEYEDVIKRPGIVPVSAADVEALIDFLCQSGKRSPVYFRLRPATADPGDDLVLEAAVATGSNWIVTHNPRDMTEGARRYAIEVVSPGEAVRRLGIVT
jgi:predicted nucleic acid-binding protein